MGSLDDTCATLRMALALLDFRLPLKFACVRDSYRSMIFEIAQLQLVKFGLTHDDTTECFYLPSDKALGFDYSLPDGHELRSLTLNDVDFINSLWPHRFPGSEFYLRNLILNNAAIGLYSKADNELIAWIMW